MEHDIIIITSDNKTNKKDYSSIIAEYLKTAAGRQQLASSMSSPLRTTRDYQSISRKIFVVDQLPEGVLPIYNEDGYNV